jgi:hypothetical protein
MPMERSMGSMADTYPAAWMFVARRHPGLLFCPFLDVLRQKALRASGASRFRLADRATMDHYRHREAPILLRFRPVDQLKL